MKYVIEWDPVVNNGVGWDLIPIWSFKRIPCGNYPPDSIVEGPSRPARCLQFCCVQLFTSTAGCPAENGPKVTTWLSTFSHEPCKYIQNWFSLKWKSLIFTSLLTALLMVMLLSINDFTHIKTRNKHDLMWCVLCTFCQNLRVDSSAFDENSFYSYIQSRQSVCETSN